MTFSKFPIRSTSQQTLPISIGVLVLPQWAIFVSGCMTEASRKARWFYRTCTRAPWRHWLRNIRYSSAVFSCAGLHTYLIVIDVPVHRNRSRGALSAKRGQQQVYLIFVFRIIEQNLRCVWLLFWVKDVTVSQKIVRAPCIETWVFHQIRACSQPWCIFWNSCVRRGIEGAAWCHFRSFPFDLLHSNDLDKVNVMVWNW